MEGSGLPRRLRTVLARNPEFGRVRQAQVFRPGLGVRVGFVCVGVAVAIYAFMIWDRLNWLVLILGEAWWVTVLVFCYSLTYTWLVVCDHGMIMGGRTVLAGRFIIPYALIDFSRFSIVGKPGWLLVGSNDARHGWGSGVWAKWAIVFRAHDAKAVMRTRDHVMRLAVAGPADSVFNSVWLRFACHEFPSELVGRICQAAAESGFPQAMASPAMTLPPTELTIREEDMPSWLRD